MDILDFFREHGIGINDCCWNNNFSIFNNNFTWVNSCTPNGSWRIIFCDCDNNSHWGCNLFRW